MRHTRAIAAFLAAPLCLHAAATDAAGMRDALARKLLAKATDPAALNDADYRTALAAHEVLRVTGDASVDALIAKYPDFPGFLAAFLGDREWTEAYLSAGNVPSGNPYGLETLYRIRKAEGASRDFAKFKQLSAGLASAFGYGDHGAELRRAFDNKPYNIDPVWRFRFFRDRRNAGRLNPMFGALKSWEMLFVVGKNWDDASYAWLNDNINVPLERYTDVCWAVTYRGESDFGDSIQGPMFYTPWRDRMPTAQNVKIHGGVCGSLSTFGATAAAAHGIPAYTCGQPGHCAYAVRVARGKWTGGFGGPDGGFHTFIWAGNIHYMETMEKVFGDDAGLNLALARAWLSRLLAASGDNAGALAELRAALAISPEHLDLRREEIALMEKAGDMTPATWRAHAESLLKTFGDNSDPAIELVSRFDAKFLGGATDDEKVAWYAKVHEAASRASASWLWSNQLEERMLGPESASLKSDAGREALLRVALAAHVKAGSLFGKTLEWGVEKFVKQGRSDAFGRAFAAATAGADSKLDPKLLRESYDRAIGAACEAKSIPAFQELGRAGARFARRLTGPAKLDKPAGRLVSDKGLIYASSTSWCSPVDFYNVLNETGGLIHSKEESAPAFTVELPEAVPLSGVLIVKNPGNEHRMRHVKLLRSTDGATWLPFAETEDMPTQWRVDAAGDVRAKWIRVEAVNPSPEFMHFRNILVFAKE